MEPNSFAALIDTNALFGVLQRNMLLSLAEFGLYRPHWTRDILSELEGSLSSKRDNVDAKRQCGRIEEAFPEAEVFGYAEIAQALTLPDPDDRHVLAGAIRIGAQVIVTDNHKDFPDGVLSTYDIEAISVDRFIAQTIELSPARAIAALNTMRERFQRPEITVERLIEIAEARGLTKTALLLDAHRDYL